MTYILVTGGAGYIGSHTAKQLSQEGYTPVVFDNLSEGNRWAVKWGPFIEGDLANKSSIEGIFKQFDIGSVIHFAASAYVGESMENARKYFRNNLGNTLNLLDVMLDVGVPRIVFSSTCATYGYPERLPISEDHPQKPVNPYGESKLFIERILHWYGEVHGLRWKALRYFNAAGADPETELGETHDPETHLIPLAIQTALGLRSHLEIYGGDYPTSDGSAVRDFIHVTDLAEAHVLALRNLLGGGNNMALNLGVGKGYSVKEVVAMVERVSGKKVPVKITPRRPGDPSILIANSEKAEKILNFTPRYSELDIIIDTALKWHVRGME